MRLVRNALLIACVATTVSAQPADDPVLGNWRGTLKSSAGIESPFVLTITRKGDGYAGSMSGLGGTSEIPLKSVTAAAGRVKVESSDDSKLGQVTLGQLLSCWATDEPVRSSCKILGEANAGKLPSTAIRPLE